MRELDDLNKRIAASKKQQRILNNKKRKAENALKYKLGGMVVKAGLDTLDDDVIIGLLFAQKKALSENKSILEQWHDLGMKVSIKPEKVGVIVKFSDKPLEEITKKLHAKKLRWNRISKQWEGTILRNEIEEIQAIAGSQNVLEIDL
tara:strand:+ start:9512 stop:9952 length:441 start_codon:yes stop_codon:yes gene_type:complete